MAASGRVEKDRILVADEKEANTLYNKGAFGMPRSGGSLLLELDEALYLVENNRLDVPGHDAASLLRLAVASEPGFETQYIVYRDLRARGFVVKRSNVTDYNVYPRSAQPGRTPSTHLVRCASERDRFRAADVADEVERAMRFEKRLLIALVDEEGDLTYYDTTLRKPTASAPALPVERTTAHLLDGNVVILNPDAARRLFADGHFGRDVGFGLQLSLPEALHLSRSQRLDVVDARTGRPVSDAELTARATAVEADIELRRALYAHLRSAGLVVKTGFKYGTHFRVYEGNPETGHAPYLIHGLPPGRDLQWPEVAGFVRLAHGVRKQLFFALATPDGDTFRLLELSRTKP